MVTVENCNFLKVNCRFLLVISVKLKQSVCFITLLYSITFYSLFLPFFVLEIFKFKYDTFFVRNSTVISKFDWFEQPWQQGRVHSYHIKNDIFYDPKGKILIKCKKLKINGKLIVWWLLSCLKHIPLYNGP